MMKFVSADIPPGLRVKVYRPDGMLGDASNFGYAMDYEGAVGKTMKTDHTWIALGATNVVLDDGKKKPFWNYHLKVIEGRNKL